MVLRVFHRFDFHFLVRSFVAKSISHSKVCFSSSRAWNRALDRSVQAGPGMGVEFSLSVLPDLSVIVMVSPSPGMKCRVAAGAFIRMAKPLPGTWSLAERVTGWRASQPATCPQKVEGGLQEKICKSLSQVEYRGKQPVPIVGRNPYGKSGVSYQ
jgi:hypothetical protein